MNQRIELSKRVKKECHAMGHDMDRFKKINQMTIGATCKTCGANIWIKQRTDKTYEITGNAIYLLCTKENKEDLKVGDSVAYLPESANARMRKDIEYGVVTSIKNDIIFVKFPTSESSQGCKKKQLRRM